MSEDEWKLFRKRAEDAHAGWKALSAKEGRDAFNTGVSDGSARAFRTVLQWMDEAEEARRAS